MIARGGLNIGLALLLCSHHLKFMFQPSSPFLALAEAFFLGQVIDFL